MTHIKGDPVKVKLDDELTEFAIAAASPAALFASLIFEFRVLSFGFGVPSFG